MANISIYDLTSESSLISLQETELGLLKNAVARAVDARQIAGGAIGKPSIIGLPFPGPTIGIIYQPEIPLELA